MEGNDKEFTEFAQFTGFTKFTRCRINKLSIGKENIETMQLTITNPVNRVNRVNSVNFLFLVLLFVSVGCASVQEYVGAAGGGQISVYLKGADRVSTDITFDLQALNIITEDGAVKEIAINPMKVNSISLSGRQLLLGEQTLPEGKYKKLQLIVKQAAVKNQERTATLALPPGGIESAIDINIRRNANTSVFLFWNADSSIGDGYLFNPVLTVSGQVPELSNLLVYVTNEESNNVSVLNRQTGDVVATVMTGKKPRGIAVSRSRERPRVYVANSDSDSISVIDPTTNKVDAEIPIRFGKSPEGITVVRISPDRELIFTANYASDNVSVIDAATYQEIDKINTGDGPIAITADPPADLLSGSRFLSFEDLNLLRNYRERFFNVYTANKNSKDVSVIKMNAITNKLEKVFQISVQWGPITIAADSQRAKVYVGNYNYDNLTVLDMAQIARGYESGVVSEITNVGTAVTGIVPDPDLDRIYLLKEASSEILIIRPFSEAFGAMKTSMGPVIGTIAVGDSPRSFIMDPEGRKLYVVNRGSDSVSVVDKTTSREEKVIPVGKKPYGIAMFPY
jgi:YVTN family beta-propeller protein